MQNDSVCFMVFISEWFLSPIVVIDLWLTDDIYLSAYVNENHSYWRTNHERLDVEQITSNFGWKTNSKRCSTVQRKHIESFELLLFGFFFPARTIMLV